LRYRQSKDEIRVTIKLTQSYQSQEYALVEVLAVSIACLHVVASVALLCGFAAAVLNEVRFASKACFIDGSTWGAALAILVRHASYFVMYSSHSGTPVFGPAVAVSVLVGAVVVLLVLAVAVVVDVFAGLFAVVLVVFVAPPQPNETRAKHAAAAIAKKFLIFIMLVFLTEIIFSAVVHEDAERR
jgi:hypothetical protein